MSNKNKTRTLSVTEYAQTKGITTQAVRWQCMNNKLPDGVRCQKVGAAWIITIKE